MKYFKKNKRLINCCVLIIIVYFLSAYDILSGITSRSGSYFWQVDKSIFGSLSDVLKTLNNFSYLSKGILTGVIVYLGNAYQIARENKNYDLFFQERGLFKTYLKNWGYSFKILAVIMLGFTIFFSFFCEMKPVDILTLVLLLINMFLYVIFLNEIALILRRKVSLFNNTRYLVEAISFSVILVEICLASRDFSLFFSPTLVNTLILGGINLLFYKIIKKNAYLKRKYNCLYITYDIK